ncbi:cytochrome C [Deferribacter autotrophicus]|uniref:Cytochrome C n=1 Tax=Deferribacter autotrophicus TaxID=500465 RepID=A0A5A8F8K0_9BACT|nr:cytochrome C [Deferribacter autotrophicus]KAA0258911.1 cytochrome C [Deferribacter autotrophicus]
MKSFFVLFFILLFNSFLYAVDDENCLLCHKYRTLSRIDENGKTRLYYVNDELFHKSVHGKIKCKECHSQITKIPHEENTKVNCLNECHIVEPSSEKRFSHKKVQEVLMNSIHNPKNKYVNYRDERDFPDCIDCHNNPLFRPIQIFKDVTEEGLSEKALARCRLCHKEEKFVKYFYNHVSHRLHNSKNSAEIVRMCNKCHGKEEMATKHKLVNAVATYSDTFHGKAVTFGYDSAPDCIDCHVKENESAHAIRSYEDPKSAVYEKNRWKTCAKKMCHPDATPGLGEVRMHVVINKDLYKPEYYTALGFTCLTLGAYLPLALILVLELIREIFPNLSFRRKRRK